MPRPLPQPDRGQERGLQDVVLHLLQRRRFVTLRAAGIDRQADAAAGVGFPGVAHVE